MIGLFVEAVGVRGPGLDGWEASRAILAGEAPYAHRPAVLPPAGLLPANERRRAPQSVRLAIAVGVEAFAAGRAMAETPTVFASSGGDGETIHAILDTLASPQRELSPTRFHNSVHNIAAGYWSIATGARTPATSLCAHDGSFSAGLIEAAAQVAAGAAAVALIAYDLPYPAPLDAARPIPAAFGAALMLTAAPSPHTIARIDIGLTPAAPRSAGTPCDADPALEVLRRGIPAARSLPLLATLAGGRPGEVTIDYLEDLMLDIRIAPVPPR